MKHTISFVFIVLLVQPSLFCADKTIAQQLQDAEKTRAELIKQRDLAQNEIAELARKRETAIQSQVQDAADRQRVRDGCAENRNQADANRDLVAKKNQLVQDANKYFLDAVATERAIFEQNGKAAQLDRELKLRQKKHANLQTELARMQLLIDSLRQKTAAEERTHDILSAEILKMYGSPQLQEQQVQLQADTAKASEQDKAVASRVRVTLDENNGLLASNHALIYTNGKLKERMAASYPQATPEIQELAQIYRDGSRGTNTEQAFLSKYPGKEDEMCNAAHTYLVNLQEYEASIRVTTAIAQSKKTAWERFRWPIAALFFAAPVALSYFIPGVK